MSNAGVHVPSGPRNLRGSEILPHCQESLKRNRYGPQHCVGDINHLLTRAGHLKLDEIEAEFDPKQRKSSMADAFGGEVELDATTFINAAGGVEQRTKPKKTSTKKASTNEEQWPRGWERFRRMVDELISDPVRYFRRSSPCTIHENTGSCSVPFVGDGFAAMYEGTNPSASRKEVQACRRMCRRMTSNLAGTCCFDWSAMGSKKMLDGVSARPNAIWLAHRVICQEDFIMHENVLGYMVKILRHYLCPTHRCFEGTSDPRKHGIPTTRPRRLLISHRAPQRAYREYAYREYIYIYKE